MTTKPPSTRPIPVVWRIVCWLVAAVLFVPGVMVVADHPALGVCLIVNALAMAVTLRLDSKLGTYLIYLGLVGAPILSFVILGDRVDRADFYDLATWPVAFVFALMPLRVCVYAVRNARRLGKTAGQILVVVLDLRRLLAFVALAPIAIWWWSHPLARTQTWVELEQWPLADRAGEHLRRGADQVVLLDAALGQDGPRVHALIDESRTWPWLACGKGILERVVLDPEDLAGDPCLTCDPGRMRSALKAAHSLGSIALLEGILDPGVVVPEERIAALAAQGRIFPSYEGGWVAESAVSGPSQMISYLFGDLCASVAAGQPASRILESGEPAFVEGLRLGHLPYVNPVVMATSPPPLMCVFCGPITGPAFGVTEMEDGSLVWTNDAGEEVVVPPIRWMFEDWEPPAPRPTMPPPPK